MLASLLATYLYATDTRSSLHRYLVPPLLRGLYPDAESAHHSSTALLKALHTLGLHPRERRRSKSLTDISVSVFDTRLENPIGISAGLDKDADIPDALFALGASVVEVGGCTPRPQDGNPKPRVWRVPSLDGMVNCYGLNSEGADAMANKLRDRVWKFAARFGFTAHEVLSGRAGVPAGSLIPGRLLLVQIAKNKETPEQDAWKDYVYCARRLARYADVIVVNVSSPNTPNLRELQSGDKLIRLLDKVVAAVEEEGRNIGRTPKVMVKVSPDEDTDQQIKGVVNAVWNAGVDGVIVGNTTKRKLQSVPPGVPITNKERGILAMADGGYSGPAMFSHTLDLVKRYRHWLDVPGFKDRKTIFATGGITDGAQAIRLAEAGADLSMVYTGLVYGGAGTVTRMKDEMRKEIERKK